MKAMVFAAGLGTRLKPFTLEHPKALVPVGGVPMLQRVLVKLKSEGITDVIVNVHHYAQQIVDFIRANNDFGINIAISNETDKLLDTGGGVVKASDWLSGDQAFILYNADIFSNIRLCDILDSHRKSHADVTLLVSQRATSRYLCFSNQSGNMVGWINKSSGQSAPEGFVNDESSFQRAFDGVHVMSPELLPLLRKYGSAKVFSLTTFYIDNCNNLKIRPFTPAGDFVWFDVGKPETLQKANDFCQNSL